MLGAPLALMLLGVLWIAFAGWNWLRHPIELAVMQRTGREMAVKGDLAVKLGWPLPRIRAERVTFANPPWAADPQMIAADAVEITIALPELLRRRIVLPEVRLENPIVALEKSADGRKTWLLDHAQQDNEAQLLIGRVMLDHGRLSYKDAGERTDLRFRLSTVEALQDGVAAGSVAFGVEGTYKGELLAAHGRGGPVLALRDESTPYRLRVEATIGRTALQADGSITSLAKLSAIDMHLVLRGESLAQLFPLIGIVLPETHAFRVNGHLTHSALMWRYEALSARIGESDASGALQIDTGGKRPFLHGDLVFQTLALNDLVPMIGGKPTARRVLPETAFDTGRWDSVDAQVELHAKTIARYERLPLESVATVLKMHDSMLTLDPLRVGVAGGDLFATISLDGRSHLIRARATVQARGLLMAKLFPSVASTGKTIGQINGDFDLAGSGDSVSGMLATSNGKVGLVIAGGRISRMMLETAGLHLWEMLELKLGGDKTVGIRCGVGNFSVKNGIMRADALVLDTDTTTINGTGSIDLGAETLDLVLNQHTKDIRVVALRGPIYVRGTFVRPDVKMDSARIAARGFGALALGIVNPLLALLPLVETGPGMDSDCGRLIREAQEPPRQVLAGSPAPTSGSPKWQ